MARAASMSSAKTGLAGRTEKKKASSDFIGVPLCWDAYSHALFRPDFVDHSNVLLTFAKSAERGGTPAHASRRLPRSGPALDEPSGSSRPRLITIAPFCFRKSRSFGRKPA